ncbi:MAG: hypothetical protein AB2L11_10235 [Syntrophobacteraceae bacterium]
MNMKKVAAWIHIVVICLIVGYGSFEMYKGRFEMAFASLPLLMGYYVFFVASRKKAALREDDEDSGDKL